LQQAGTPAVNVCWNETAFPLCKATDCCWA